MKTPPLRAPVALLEPLRASLAPAEAEVVVAFLTQAVVRKKQWTQHDTHTLVYHTLGASLPLPPELVTAIAGHLPDAALPPLSAVFFGRLGGDLSYAYSRALARSAQLTDTKPEAGWPRKLLQFAQSDAGLDIKLTPSEYTAKCLISGLRHFAQIPGHTNLNEPSVKIALEFAANQMLHEQQYMAFFDQINSLILQQPPPSTEDSRRRLYAINTFSPKPNLDHLRLLTADEKQQSIELLQGSIWPQKRMPAVPSNCRQEKSKRWTDLRRLFNALSCFR